DLEERRLGGERDLDPLGVAARPLRRGQRQVDALGHLRFLSTNASCDSRAMRWLVLTIALAACGGTVGGGDAAIPDAEVTDALTSDGALVDAEPADADT